MSVLSICFNANKLRHMRSLFFPGGPVITLPQRGRQPELSQKKVVSSELVVITFYHTVVGSELVVDYIE